MFCKNCGAELADGAAFCTNCGARLEAPANPYPDAQPNPYSGAPANTYAAYPPPAAPAAYPANTPKKSSRKWLIPVIIGIVVAAVVILVLVLKKTCPVCGKTFWFGGKTYFGQTICGDCADKLNSGLDGLSDLIGGLGSLFG